MKRRTFIAGLGSAVAWPVVARAQQPTIPMIGWLASRTPQSDALLLRAFHQGLAAQGYVEGRNVTVEYRWAGGDNRRFLSLAADLPVQQATRTELIINRKIAEALGLTIPETLLATADEVIQ